MADTTFGATAALDAPASASPIFSAELAHDEHEFIAACSKFFRRFGPDAAAELLCRLDGLTHAGPQAT
ncbi:MAG: hypothetical protein AB9M53_09855 [Leptothrix sp. (in: b-proteobacteria)]